jgi:hypothetical protein
MYYIYNHWGMAQNTNTEDGMARYREISPEEWKYYTYANGWRIIGASEGGITKQRGNRIVFWDDDNKTAYEVYE